MKRPFGHLLLIGFGLLLGLATTEVALRLLPLPDLQVYVTWNIPPRAVWADPQWQLPPDHTFLAHPVLYYEHAPNAEAAVLLSEHSGGSYLFRTNNLGLRRDADTSVSRDSNTYRILVLGDSHVDGYVDNAELFTTLLEHDLSADAAPGRRVEVLNAGVGGYAPSQERDWYRLHGRQLQPDLVLAVSYVGNDLEWPYAEGEDPAARLEELSPLDPRRSRVGTVARWAVKVGPLREPWRRLGLPGWQSRAGYPLDTLVRALRTCEGCYFQSLQQASFAHHDPPKGRQALALAGEFLVELDQMVRADGSRFAVALLPSRWQVEPDLADDDRRAVATLLGLGSQDLVLDDLVTSTCLLYTSPSPRDS